MTSAPRTVPPARWIAVVACLFAAHVIYLNCVAEDAFIALRFASNLAHGHGLVWNPGTPPVEGYTDFLWVMLLAGAIKIGLPPVGFAQALSVAAGAGVIALTYRIGRTQFAWPPAAAMIPALLLAVCGPLATWSSSGMEQTLFTLLILAAADALARFWRDGETRSALLAALAIILAALTRPEGILIALLLFGTSATAALVLDRRRLGAMALAILVFAVGYGSYFAWRYSRYGYLMPNTYYAKTGGGIYQILRGGLLAYLFLMQFALPLIPAVLVAAWERGRPAWPRLDRAALGEFFERHAFAILAAIICVGYTANNVLVGGDYMAMHRFFVPVLPFMYLLIGIPIAALHARIATGANAFGYALLIAFISLGTFFPSTPLERSFFASPPQQHGDYRGVQIERWHVARLSAIGRFFDGYRRDPSESLATTAIGAIGFHANMQILDIHGLVDTHIAHMPPPPDMGRRRAGHERQDLPYTFSLNPTYVMFSRDLTPAPIELWRYVPADLRPEVERHYVHQAAWLNDPVNGERGYFTFFERRDSAARRTPGTN
jgi:hypothetical protein